MIPDTEFTAQRIGDILGSGLNWLASEDEHEVFIEVSLRDLDNEGLGIWLRHGYGVDIIIDGVKHTVTRQTIIDGVQRQLEWEGATPEKLAQFDSPYDLALLWGADDVASSILRWGLGIHEG